MMDQYSHHITFSCDNSKVTQSLHGKQLAFHYLLNLKDKNVNKRTQILTSVQSVVQVFPQHWFTERPASSDQNVKCPLVEQQHIASHTVVDSFECIPTPIPAVLSVPENDLVCPNKLYVKCMIPKNTRMSYCIWSHVTILEQAN